MSGTSRVTVNGIDYEGDGDVSYVDGQLTIGGKPAVRATGGGGPAPQTFPPTFYPSTADRRAVDASPTVSATGSIAGGAFRSVYQPLSDVEKGLIDRIKLHAEDFHRLLAEAGGTDPATDKLGSRNLQMAFGHMEDAVYRAVKHVTGPR